MAANCASRQLCIKSLDFGSLSKLSKPQWKTLWPSSLVRMISRVFSSWRRRSSTAVKEASGDFGNDGGADPAMIMMPAHTLLLILCSVRLCILRVNTQCAQCEQSAHSVHTVCSDNDARTYTEQLMRAPVSNHQPTTSNVGRSVDDRIRYWMKGWRRIDAEGGLGGD